MKPDETLFRGVLMGELVLQEISRKKPVLRATGD
jgi:hypothetical protein